MRTIRFKRFVAVVTMVALSLTYSVVESFAGTNIAVSSTDTVQSEAVIQIVEKCNMSKEEAVSMLSRDLRNLSKYGMESFYLASIEVVKGEVVYYYDLPFIEGLTEIRTQDIGENLVIDFREEGKHDVLNFMKNGEVYLDGEKVIFLDEEVNISMVDSNIAEPQAGIKVEYSETPYGSSSGYSEYLGKFQVKGVKANKKLIDLAKSTLAALLRTALTGEGILKAALESYKLLSHATSIQSIAEQRAPKADVVSISILKHEHKLSTGLIKMYEYQMTYYLAENFSGAATMKYLYERITTY